MLLFAMDSSLRWNDENQLVQSVHCELCVLCGPFVFPNIPYSSRSREARNQGALAESTSNTYICTHGRTAQPSSAANPRFHRRLECGARPATDLARDRGAVGLASAQFGPGSCRGRSEEHTSELQSLMRISYAVFCLKKKN